MNKEELLVYMNNSMIDTHGLKKHSKHITLEGLLGELNRVFRMHYHVRCNDKADNPTDMKKLYEELGTKIGNGVMDRYFKCSLDKAEGRDYYDITPVDAYKDDMTIVEYAELVSSIMDEIARSLVADNPSICPIREMVLVSKSSFLMAYERSMHEAARIMKLDIGDVQSKISLHYEPWPTISLKEGAFDDE